LKLLLIDQSNSGGWLANRLGGLGFIPEPVDTLQEAIRGDRAANVRAILIEGGGQGNYAANLVGPLRRAGVDRPLMVLSPREDWREMIHCLDAGADDFLAKPVRSDVIAARLRALIRRGAGRSSDRIMLGDIEIDLRTMCAWLHGSCLDLTRNEFRLLRLFLLETDRALTHEEIRGQLYSDVDECSQNAVEVLVARLRRKVGRDSIRTVRGVGYRFNAGKAPPVLVHGERKSCTHSGKANDEASVGSASTTWNGATEARRYSWSYAI